MCSCAGGGSSARTPLDAEHLQMLEYLILMIHGGRMRKGKEELIKDSGKKVEDRGNLSGLLNNVCSFCLLSRFLCELL